METIISKKVIIFLACVPIILVLFGCQNASTKSSTDAVNKKIENILEITIGYLANSYVAVIKEKQEIKQLQDLFNSAEFTRSDASIQQPSLRISFAGQKGSIVFCIDEKDVIKLEDGNCVKSEQISFNKLYSIFRDYSLQKK